MKSTALAVRPECEYVPSGGTETRASVYYSSPPEMGKLMEVVEAVIVGSHLCRSLADLILV